MGGQPGPELVGDAERTAALCDLLVGVGGGLEQGVVGLLPGRVVGGLVDAGELLLEVGEPVCGDAVGVGLRELLAPPDQGPILAQTSPGPLTQPCGPSRPLGPVRETPGIGAMRTRLRGAPPDPPVLAVPQRWRPRSGARCNGLAIASRSLSDDAPPARSRRPQPAASLPPTLRAQLRRAEPKLPGGISQYLPRRSCRRHASSPASNGLIGRPSQPAAAAANVLSDRLLSPGPRPAHPLTSLPLPVDRPPLRVSAERTDHPGLHLRTGAG